MVDHLALPHVVDPVPAGSGPPSRLPGDAGTAIRGVVQGAGALGAGPDCEKQNRARPRTIRWLDTVILIPPFSRKLLS